MSEALFKAIYTKYSTTNDFNTATGGRLEYEKALDTWTDNFAVVQGTDIMNNDMFRKDVERVYFQINVFSTVRATCWSLVDKCKSLFHRCELTPSGYNKTLVLRSMMVPPIWNEDDNLWQATIEFSCTIEKTT